ncbi:hypothetical protein Tco_0097555 [Tanacetum coccineum]
MPKNQKPRFNFGDSSPPLYTDEDLLGQKLRPAGVDCPDMKTLVLEFCLQSFTSLNFILGHPVSQDLTD